MGLSPEEYASGRNELREVLHEWDIDPQSARESESDRFTLWLKRMQDRGWTRKDVHSLVTEIINESPQIYSDSTIGGLEEFETALTGFCDPSCITRFPGDPADVNELVKHVRGNGWR